MKIKDVSLAKDGTIINGAYLVKKCSREVAKNGNPYYALTLEDKTGTIRGYCWDELIILASDVEEGKVIKCKAEKKSFNSNPQVVVTECVSEEFNINSPIASELIRIPDKGIDYYIKEADRLIETVKGNEDCYKLLKYVFSEDYPKYNKLISSCAAISVHHAYYGGLIEHLVGVAKVCEKVSELYPEIKYEILITGALLHDLGKIDEMGGYSISDYTPEGDLLGHSLLGILELENISAKLNIDEKVYLQIKHILASHHGRLEYGAVVLPQTIEAIIVNYADGIDSKSAICRDAISKLEPDTIRTPKLFALESKVYNI